MILILVTPHVLVLEIAFQTQARTLVLGLLPLATGPDSRPVMPYRASFPPEHWPPLAKHQPVH